MLQVSKLNQHVARLEPQYASICNDIVFWPDAAKAAAQNMVDTAASQAAHLNAKFVTAGVESTPRPGWLHANPLGRDASNTQTPKQ